MKKNPRFSGISLARDKIRAILPETPLVLLEWGESKLWCKCESDQPVGAFKIRGAWHRLSALSRAERAAGVVAFSSGNHAQGVAWAAARLGISATIVMPSDAPAVKIDATREMGADIILYDRMTENRDAIAAGLAKARGSVVVPPFDDPWIIEGQGTVGLECVSQFAALGLEPPDLIVTPCGGGGLASGLALAVPGARIVCVEPEGWDDLARSLQSGEIVPVASDPPPTLCDALKTLQVSPLTFSILQARDATGVAVNEDEVTAAMQLAWQRLGRRIEPGGAVALAALLSGKVLPMQRTLVILSGGNVDEALFARLVSG